MNKLFYIFIALVIFLSLAIGVTWVVQHNANVSSVGPHYTDLSVTLPTTNGKTVSVSNFLKEPEVNQDPQNNDLYFLGNTFSTDSSGGENPAYVVTYEKDSGYFNIALLKKPLATSRLAVETYMKNLLQVDDTELCGLSYSLTVPGYVDTAASGIDYRFSFCPDSIPLR